MNSLSQQQVIHPADTTEMVYWTKKWGVSLRDINDAILDTGSINLLVIKSTLRQKHQLKGFFFKTAKLFKHLIGNTGQKHQHNFSGLRRVA